MKTLHNAQRGNMDFIRAIIDTLSYALYMVNLHIDPYQENNS